MKKNISLITLLVIFITLPCQAQTESHSYRITSAVISGGGSKSESMSYKSHSTIGQPSPLPNQGEVAESSSYRLQPGFWSALESECDPTPTLWIIPRLIFYSSSDTDNIVFFDSSGSSCYERQNCVNQELTCNYEISYGDSGFGRIVGGNGANIVVYQYDAAGDYTASLTMTEQDSSTTVSDNLTVNAEIVETPLPAIDFISDVANANVSIIITDLDPSDTAIESVIVYWGDRYRVEYSLPAAINHTYTRTGTDYHIRVQIVNTEGEAFNYTFMADEDLRVSIP